MNVDTWQRIRELFHAAIELPEDEREAYLVAHCEDDLVRREVHSLLRQDNAGTFMAESALGSVFGLNVDALAMDELSDRRIGTQIGRYRVLSKLATGGMGTVYLASRADEAYHAKAALKLVRPGLDGEAFLDRFLRERQTLANLNHPNIGRLLDGGSTDDGVPYFVMEYIDGVPIDQYCDENRLSVIERLRLFRTVCETVHFAHQNLVIHRDIKPSNILITKEGTPKLLDFGIAKVLDSPETPLSSEVAAHTRQVLLTPEYASPEQIRGEIVTTETDVYSLGVVLYVLLTGSLPHSLTSRRMAEIERTISDEPARKPSTAIVQNLGRQDDVTRTLRQISDTRRSSPQALRRQLRGDLDNIVLMALRKEPNRRYQSAEQFSADIERYLSGQPVIARKDTLGYRSFKFIRRNRLGVTAAATIAVALSGGIIATTWQAQLVAHQRDAARDAESRASEQAEHARIEAESAQRAAAFLIDVFRQADPRSREPGNVTAREVLDRAAARIRYEMVDQPHLRANLMDTLGRVYLNLGLYDDAEELVVVAQRLRLETFGPTSEEYALSLNSMGELDHARGRLQPAEETFRKSLELQRSLGSGAHVNIAAALNNLATAVASQGRLEEAKLLHEEALALRIDAYGESSLPVAVTLNNLGSIALRSARYQEAEELNRRVLSIRTDHLDENHPDIAQSLSNLAVCLHYQSKFEEANDHYEQAIDRLRRNHGRHPDLARTLTARASLLMMTGEPSAALPLHQEALEMLRELLPPHHPSIANSLSQIGDLLRQLQRFDEAEQHIRESVDIRRIAQGNSHPDLATSLSAYASLLDDRGRPGEAEPLWREALEVYQAALPEDHWFISVAKVGLGRTLLELGDLEEAHSLLLQAHEHLQRKRGEGDPYTYRAHTALTEATARLTEPSHGQ